jgi:hypothetical protein
VSFGFNQVSNNSFAFKIFLSKLSESITTNFADEASIHSASTGPDRNVCCTSSGREHHFTKGVSAVK